MRNAVLVDDRVRRDAARDEDAEAGSRSRVEPAHEQDAARDEEDAGDLVACRRSDRAEEDEHRREPPRERVDDRELAVPVAGREQREVRDLEQRARDDVGPGACVEVPERDRDRCACDRRHG